MLFQTAMDLYDINARGFPSPLNAREISQLFRAGQLHPRTPCKPKGDASWRTIDELFPLLKYEAAAPRLHFDDQAEGGRGAFVLSAKVVLCVLGSLAAFHFHSRPAPRAHSPNPLQERPHVIAPARHPEEALFSGVAAEDRPAVR